MTTQTETKWTPGPWRLDEWRHVVGPDGRQIRCTGLALAGGNVDMEEPEANDVLIAAAPDLYAALSALADLARSTVRPSGQPALCRALLDIEGIARVAIAKAEGQVAMPAKLTKAEALFFSGTPDEIKAALADQVCWPDGFPLPEGAVYALAIDVPDEDGDATETLIIEVLDAAMEVLDRVVL